MGLELASIPLAWLAGILSILSPCVWPLVPVVMTSAAGQGRQGPVYFALGLSCAFALAGGLLTFVLLNSGLNPDAFRWFAAAMLVLVGMILIIKPLSDWVSLRLSLLSSRLNIGNPEASSAIGQFGVGMLLGLVWLPCVGPTLGAAIALASVGQDLGTAFIIMFAFGIGTALALIAAAFLSGKLLNSFRPQLLSNVGTVKIMLGWSLLLLGLMVFTGIDKVLEIFALQYLPDWSVSF
ncbi:cytochrome C biogenesis protein [Methylophaga sp. 41_12_T18]|nr:cytochrome C biogenesis protein [Methylophaga sp. 41_12_T18]